MTELGVSMFLVLDVRCFGKDVCVRCVVCRIEA